MGSKATRCKGGQLMRIVVSPPPFRLQDNVLIFYVPHDIDGLFSLVHEFLTRSYEVTFFFCHGATISDLKRLANRFPNTMGKKYKVVSLHVNRKSHNMYVGGWPFHLILRDYHLSVNKKARIILGPCLSPPF